ncbi:MAG: hypothetical protein LIP11_05360 [Clostridiales bacterium]|nr:hypothetical protein [Clostridiales bacterium]
MRRYIDFNERWLFSKEKEIVEKVYAALEGRYVTDCAVEEDRTGVAETAGKMEAITLPNTWNAIDGQDGGNAFCGWYVTIHSRFSERV